MDEQWAANHSGLITGMDGSGLWLARTNVGVKRTAVSLVRPVVPFQHAGQPVQGLLLIAAQDALHKPVLERLVDMISEQNVAQSVGCRQHESHQAADRKPIEGLKVCSPSLTHMVCMHVQVRRW